MKPRSLVNVIMGAALAIGAGAIAAPPAQAAARDGVCNAGEFCYYYNTGPAGSLSDFTTSVSDYGTNPATCYVFKTAGLAGYNQCIKNNAAAVRNLTSQTVRIYYNSGNSGPYLDIAPGAVINLQGTQLYNNNASHQFLSAPTTPPSVPAPYNAGIIAAASTHAELSYAGQCAIFVESLIKQAGGPQVYLGSSLMGYQASWARYATEVTWAQVIPGDVVQFQVAPNRVHTLVITGGNTEATATIIDSNFHSPGDGLVRRATFSSRLKSFGAGSYKIWRVHG